MKTKLYTFITGLLMAACYTSYGQQIVSEFASTAPSYYCELVEASDGNFIIGSCIDLYNGRKYTVYKVSPEGNFLISADFNNVYDLLEFPSDPNIFLLSGYEIDDIDNTYHLALTFIDAELNTINEVSIPIGEFGNDFWDGNVFVTPNDEIIFPYSIGPNDVFHIMRIAKDGALLEDKAFPAIPRGTWDFTHANAPVAFYSDINVTDKTPLTYHCLGFSKNKDGEAMLVNYVLDDHLNLVECIEYTPYDQNSTFEFDYNTFISTLGTNPALKPSYLSSSLNYNSAMLPAIVKYDTNNQPEAIRKFSSYATPGIMATKDENTIYFTLTYYGAFISIVRLDGNLDVAWNFPLPNPTSSVNALNTVKVLRNGDIAIGVCLYSYSNEQPIFKFFIIRDNYDAIPETATVKRSFNLYPNPVKDQLSLIFTDDIEPESVELYDLSSRLVGTKRNGLESIDISSIPAGIYILHVTLKDGTSYYEKIMKE